MNITILALQDLFDTGLFVTLDAFTLANKLSARHFGGTPHFEVTLLRSSNLDIDAIAIEVGYVDGATLRNLLYARLGRGVREIRSDLL